MAKQQAIVVESHIMWAATAHAFRVNQGYYKYPEVDSETAKVKKQSNRDIINQIMIDASQLTPEDYDQGQKLFTAMQGLIFQQIAGTLNSFTTEILKLTEKTQWPSNDRLAIAILASVPLTYQRQQRNDEINQLKKFSSHIGKIGQRVDSLTVKVLANTWSNQWQTHFVTAITNDKNVLFFSNRTGAAVGETFFLTGRIKRHADQGQTQLNYVKLTK